MFLSRVVEGTRYEVATMPVSKEAGSRMLNVLEYLLALHHLESFLPEL